MAKNLSYFMRTAKEEIVKVPAPESFKDENGNRLEMEIKVLSAESVRKINEKYNERSVAVDRKGKPYFKGNEILFETKNDAQKALRHIIAEALVYPNLKDRELMDFYKCFDITEMLEKVFSSNEEYNYVVDTVLKVLGLIENDEDKKDDVEEAKN